VSHMKPFSQACENNKTAIVEVLRHALPAQGHVLEIGSGTGQHATWFARCLPGVYWIPSDLPDHLPTLLAGLEGCEVDNLAAPLALDVTQQPWPVGLVDGIFSANTLHIMSLEAVDTFFTGVGKILTPGGRLCIYGPFKYAGRFTSQSNAGFDEWLKQRNPVSGVRDIEQIQAWAQAQDLSLIEDHAMPANNQLLVWERQRPISGISSNSSAG